MTYCFQLSPLNFSASSRFFHPLPPKRGPHYGFLKPPLGAPKLSTPHSFAQKVAQTRVLCVRGRSRTQAIRGWPGPPTDNPPHAKSPAVHCKGRILDSIILIRISYLPVCAIHEFSPDLKKHTVPCICISLGVLEDMHAYETA